MQIHALTTGTVQVKRSFLFPGAGARRQLDLFLPGPWADELPIHCWAVEHGGRLLLVDTGETAAARNIPFARFKVAREQELDKAFAGAGLSPADVSEVVLTHHHGDHVDGLVHVHAPARINDAELRFTRTAFPSVMRRVLRQPLPPGFAPEPFALDGGPFGAFERSRPLSDDGRIVAVPTPGHTPGHISVICVDDSDRHVMLAGSSTRGARTRSGPTRRCTSRRSKRSSPTARSTRPSTCPRTTPSPRPVSPARSPSPSADVTAPSAWRYR
jgi:N-acyl homoserine lactone hydrolase